VKWVPDTTGRFAQRPHYDPAEIDAECEPLVSQFLRHRHGAVRYPISTDDLIVLLEREAADVDIYADLTGEGPAVEGATYFAPQGKPTVKIARHLAEDPWAVNRFRTTATHELGHVRFHAFLWPLEPSPALFYPDDAPTVADPSPRCRRDSIHMVSTVDWMEWQAGYACGSLLMPLTALRSVVDAARRSAGLHTSPAERSAHATALTKAVAAAFEVSAEAARVRLTQLRLLRPAGAQTADLPF
jgi:hypothetical protein